MNKTEKIICLLLGAVLAWYVFTEIPKQKKAAEERAKVAAVVASTNAPSAAVAANSVAPSAHLPTAKAASVAVPKAEKPSVPEKTVSLENDQLKLELSSWGAVVKRATLKQYAHRLGKVSDENPPVVLDFSDSPLGALDGVAGLAPNAAYEVRSVDSNSVVFVNAAVTRKVTLGANYQVSYEETFHASPTAASTLSLGVMQMGVSKNDLLSIDSFVNDPKGGKAIHHGEEEPLKDYLVGGLSGGCGGSKSAAGLPATMAVPYRGEQKWVAVKNRFFVTALARSTEPNDGFVATVARDVRSANYRPESVAAKVSFPNVGATRTSVFYVGPKKQSLLWDLGMRDVMEFGIWRWICYPLVWILNVFNSWIPNYGIAIILLTILVRIVFWPLTHKSTVGMKKMQEIQPLMKEIQKKFKDNPQRLQQETWALYRDHNVNPMSSCLPMLIQIPVFIALFNVLRSAVELRYAPFLWIADLSEPEGLFAGWFPFGGLNILPILMAATMALQSALTPSTGDKSQQRMMMIFMPVMMLVMFYSFPSALSLYWTLSQVFSIVQMWLIRRQSAAKAEVLTPEVIDPPQQTRQMRRHGRA